MSLKLAQPNGEVIKQEILEIKKWDSEHLMPWHQFKHSNPLLLAQNKEHQ